MNKDLTFQADNFKKRSFSSLIHSTTKKRVLKKKEARRRPLPSQLISKEKKGIKKSRKADEVVDLKLKRARSRFSLLAAVVEHLKTRYLSDNRTYVSLDDVLKATDNGDSSFVDITWLLEVALPSNSRVKIDGKNVMYSPPYELTDKYSLFKIFNQFDDNGLGGIYLDDVRDSLANFDHVLRVIRHHYCHVTRKDNDKDVLFLYDPSYVVEVDDDLIKLWKKISTCGLEDTDIAAELTADGLNPIVSTTTTKKKNTNDQKKPRKRKIGKITNTHLPDTFLQEYSKKFN